MNRRNLWALLFAPQVQAQETNRAGTMVVYNQNDTGNSFLSKAKPENKRCPVCGTLAEPYAVIPEEGVGLTDCRTYKEDGSVVVCDPIRIGPAYPSRITRCKHCNAAFWQDAKA